jgi:hypothetical protein
MSDYLMLEKMSEVRDFGEKKKAGSCRPQKGITLEF